jgi:predicted transcriptional regulator
MEAHVQDEEHQGGTAANLVELSAGIVSAYVAKNRIQVAELPALIESVHQALNEAEKGPERPVAPVPPVPINKTVRHDYIISLEDGRHYKSLARHLSSRGLAPDEYRKKWGLPPSYPMTAPAYAEQRSQLAKSMGLGRRRSGHVEEQAQHGQMQEPEVAASQPANDDVARPPSKGKTNKKTSGKAGKKPSKKAST